MDVILPFIPIEPAGEQFRHHALSDLAGPGQLRFDA